MMLLELPHICMGSVNAIRDHDQFLKAFDAVIMRHDLEKVAVVGQSYGTIMASWMIQQRPQHLTHAYLVDPVCFLMWDPELIYSFLYEGPKCMFHELAREFLSRDPLIMHTLTQELYWYESNLYPEEITVPTTVFLAEDDWIVNPIAHKEYLEKRLPSQSKLVMLDTFHGGVLFHHDYISQFIANL
ncbi:hypothetical protein DSO57_1013234 [Entomophthora muscae]|uniref:Uncharacterized protein n=1 Tax=Entomophthora muscae TaxID=34485 RepID=A0ACC2TT58_9FUNG|nr:hypothetical protein DSO57_1013234 [Entomophthora muscae]